MSPYLSSLWAKTAKDGRIHLLIYHLIDVSQVALAMWDLALGDGMRRWFRESLGQGDETTARLLAFWIGLHDIGKAYPVFQGKYKPAQPVLSAAGMAVSRHVDMTIPHGWATFDALGHRRHGLLHTSTALDVPAAQQIARAVAGHHGSWPLPQETQRLIGRNRGDEAWQQAREQLFAGLAETLDAPIDVRVTFSPEDQGKLNAFLTVLSGLTSVVDWIGSMEEFFPFHGELMPLADYAALSRRQAEMAVRTTGWAEWQSSGDLLSFTEMFADFRPNALQQQVIDFTERSEPPLLAIVEAPTGTGKTEVAFYLADRWTQMGRGQGIYIAMPTQATSNQMYDRTCDFLRTRYPDLVVAPPLLHSQAQWRIRPDEQRPANLEDDDTAHVLRWFMPKKRGLLVPFAVGTVDQALLGVLLTRHFFVRLFGLGQKVVIFDEVHAYDTYMSTLFERLLQWLGALGSSVIILSATLPESVRRRLVSAYTGQLETAVEPSTDYPRLTLASRSTVITTRLAVDDLPSRSVHLEWLGRDDADLVALVLRHYDMGGCIVVLCNTVKRAQQVYCLLKDVIDEDDLLLFHSRFPPVWRQDIEREVLERFGKAGRRPERAVLVATQVVEQSLDLDFDLMITDIPPIDMLIQRVGRLHRHDRVRPLHVAVPYVYLRQPEFDARGVPHFGRGDEYIYGRFPLLATWLHLQDRDRIVLPDDTIDLIEGVYSEAWRSLPMQDELDQAFAEMQATEVADAIEAQIREIYPPDAEGLLTQPNPALSEDDPSTHERFRALTRLIDPGVSVICLHHTPNGPALDPDGWQWVDFGSAPDREEIQQILQCVITVQDRRLVPALVDAPTHQLPAAWRETELQHHRIAEFREGRCPVEGTPYTLVLTRELGLQVTEEDS